MRTVLNAKNAFGRFVSTACREIISIILQEDHDYNMRRGQRLTTILLSLLLVFTLLTTAFAESADMGVQSAPTQENTEESTGLQTAESSEEPAAGAEPGTIRYC